MIMTVLSDLVGAMRALVNQRSWLHLQRKLYCSTDRGVFNGLYQQSDDANTILTVLTELNIAADAVPSWSPSSTDFAVRPYR